MCSSEAELFEKFSQKLSQLQASQEKRKFARGVLTNETGHKEGCSPKRLLKISQPTRRTHSHSWPALVNVLAALATTSCLLWTGQASGLDQAEHVGPTDWLQAGRAARAAHQSSLGHGDVHKLMSEQDLRRTFQVASHDQVPEYEVLKLAVRRTPDARQSGAAELQTISETSPGERGHGGGGSGRAKRSAPEEQQAREPQRQQREQLPVAARPDKRLLVIDFSTFGRDFKLRLKRNADFQQRIKDMKMFLVESTADGQLRYTVDALLNGRQPMGQNGTNSRPSGQAADWSLGTTYHDEQNLAALLIERNAKTGEIQLDGTIGNDFVIKPMPKAALELLEQRQRQHERAPKAKPGRAEELRGGQSGNSTSLGATSGEAQTTMAAASSLGLDLERAAQHLHDDDPHDDDEMFLDEDEALELAHQFPKQQQQQQQQQQQVASGNETQLQNSSNLPQQQQQQQSRRASGQPQQARTLSKAASEHKWRKYRKLMAQTQAVPRQPPPPPQAGREKRQAADSEQRPDEEQLDTGRLQISHHIVYRQKPAAKEQPGGQAHSFGDLAQSMARHLGASARAASAERDLTDLAEDPLGGQFYLEPARLDAGLDWRLTSGGLNSSGLNATTTTTATSGGAHLPGGRFRRHAQRSPKGRLGPAAASRRQPRAAASRQRHKRQAPDTVWPEVLLVVDYDSFLLHGGDSRDVKRYFVSFWNGVDLRYKLLVHPHIRISLAGMIVAKDRDATPYLERNRLRAPNADAVDAAGALTDMGKYLYREDRLPTYDLAVVITKLDMCRRRYEGGRCNRGTAGFAYVGGACVVNKRLEKVNSVAIIEDSGGFSGIIVAAHEVGHL